MKQQIKEFPNYEIELETGDIFSKGWKNTRYHEPRKLKKVFDKGNGYFLVSLVDGKGLVKNRFVHRLMAQTFLENPLNKPQVNHKDGNKTNNSLDNLEWVTGKENSIHAVNLGLTTHYHCFVGVEQVINDMVIASFKSIKDAERTTGVASQNICKVCNNKRKSAGGFSWRYKKSSETIPSGSRLPSDGEVEAVSTQNTLGDDIVRHS